MFILWGEVSTGEAVGYTTIGGVIVLIIGAIGKEFLAARKLRQEHEQVMADKKARKDAEDQKQEDVAEANRVDRLIAEYKGMIERQDRQISDLSRKVDECQSREQGHIRRQEQMMDRMRYFEELLRQKGWTVKPFIPEGLGVPKTPFEPPAEPPAEPPPPGRTSPRRKPQ